MSILAAIGIFLLILIFWRAVIGLILLLLGAMFFVTITGNLVL